MSADLGLWRIRHPLLLRRRFPPEMAPHTLVLMASIQQVTSEGLQLFLLGKAPMPPHLVSVFPRRRRRLGHFGVQSCRRRTILYRVPLPFGLLRKGGAEAAVPEVGVTAPFAQAAVLPTARVTVPGRKLRPHAVQLRHLRQRLRSSVPVHQMAVTVTSRQLGQCTERRGRQRCRAELPAIRSSDRWIRRAGRAVRAPRAREWCQSLRPRTPHPHTLTSTPPPSHPTLPHTHTPTHPDVRSKVTLHQMLCPSVVTWAAQPFIGAVGL